jgi:hypothetical protein
MLFQFFRPQLEQERPTISSTMRRANENGQMDIGAYMRLEVVGDAASSSANPVITVKGRHGSAAKRVDSGPVDRAD